MLSKVHRGNESVQVTINTKVDWKHVQLQISLSQTIQVYNTKMGRVDSFDQRAVAYRTLRRKRKYGISIFLDIIDLEQCLHHI